MKLDGDLILLAEITTKNGYTISSRLTALYNLDQESIGRNSEPDYTRINDSDGKLLWERK